MTRSLGSAAQIAMLRSFAGKTVQVSLSDGSAYAGRLRTELLSERSISVFIARDETEGTTLYIDDIVGVWPTS